MTSDLILGCWEDVKRRRPQYLWFFGNLLNGKVTIEPFINESAELLGFVGLRKGGTDRQYIITFETFTNEETNARILMESINPGYYTIEQQKAKFSN